VTEEWESIGKGAEICTNSSFTEKNYGFFYEEFVPLNTGVKPKDSTVEVYKKENEEYSYILVHHFDQQHNLINEVIMRFKL
tara:strand:- start:847 stop:1089 length:243 start_codon:yes stop_codon:yes gene_type:complete